VLKDLQMNITRMSAQLNGKQAEQLTKYFENQRKGRERRVREAQRLSEAKRITVVNVPPVKVPQKWDKHCNCCGRDWVLTAVENQTESACPSCVDHTSQKEEDSARAIRRACDHAEQFRADRDRYRDFAEKANSEKLAAFRSRMKWTRALAEVMLDHDETDEGVCWCGDPHPCRTWRKLEEANKGIHREVEKWASMPDDVLEERACPAKI
jgi:hypothetical protein